MGRKMWYDVKKDGERSLSMLTILMGRAKTGKSDMLLRQIAALGRGDP